MRSLLALLITCGALIAPTGAAAEQFTFTVPVRVENMRHVTRAWVNCSVRVVRPTLSMIGPGGPGPSIALRDGAFTGTVTTTVTLPAHVSIDDIDSWQCGLVYLWRLPDGSEFNQSLLEGQRDRLYTQTTGQEIASSVLIASGPIPR